MGFLSRFFGQEGKVRFKITFADGSTATAKITIEAFNVSNAELERRLARMVEIEMGRPVKSIKLLGFAQTN